jgi:P4 family phage/plasmid primase-like protien
MQNYNSCDLFKYLNKRSKPKKGQETNTSMIGGKYVITDNEYKEFLKIYAEEVDRNRNNLHLTERFADISPIVIDLDFKFESNDEIKNLKVIMKEIILLHFNYFKEHFEYNKKLFHCFALIRNIKPYYDPKSKKYKGGIHLHFPNICTTKNYKIIMRDKLKNKTHEICKKINNINSENDVYDKGVVENRVFWLLYGSSKPKLQPYQIHSRWFLKEDGEIKYVTKNYTSKTHQLVKLLSVRRDRDITPYKSQEVANELSYAYDSRQTKIVAHITDKQDKMFLNCKFNHTQKIVGLEDYELNELLDLISCLNKKRSEKYDHWVSVGLILYNISPNLLPVWKEFSQLCTDKYDENECENKWNSFSGDNFPFQQMLKLGTLRMWAHEDNEDKYNKLVTNKHIFDLVKQLARNPTHYDTAKTLYRMYNKILVCSIDSSLKKWYIYDRHKWNEKPPELHLRDYISNQLVHETHKITEYYNACYQQNTGITIQDKENKDLVNIQRLTNNFKNVGFKSSVIKECETVFGKDAFHLELNNIKCHKHIEHLIVLENGVYDFKTHSFRDGKPSDMISLSSNMKYDPTAESKDMEEFLNQILPDPELREYVLKLLAISLTGVFLQHLFIFIGVGSNGKNTLLDLLEEVLGSEYFTAVHHTIITKGKHNSSGPSPEIAKTCGKRVLVMEEPDTRDRINVGQLKWLTGGGNITGRFLNENEIEFKPAYKVFFLVNNEPHIDSVDHGTWRRIRCIPFLSIFTENPDPSNANEYKIDKTVKNNFPKWAPAFFNLLIKHYKLWQENGLKEPAVVIKETNKFKAACDYIYAFTNISIIKTDNKSDEIAFPDIYRAFESWYRQNRGSRVPEPGEFKQLIEAHYFKCKAQILKGLQNGWTGYKFINNEDDFIE